MRKVSWRQGSAAVGAAVAGVLVTASVAWACAPGPIGGQWEFIVTPQSAAAGTMTPDWQYQTPLSGDPQNIPSVYVGPGSDSASRTVDSKWVVAGYLSGLATYPGVNYAKLFLAPLPVGSVSNPPPKANEGKCTTTHPQLLNASVTIRDVNPTPAAGTRSEINGDFTILANTKAAGVYLVCSGARIDLWYDTITLV